LGKLEVSVAHSACEWWQAKAALGREHGAGGRAGLTKGYSPDHTDFYVPNGRPKKLWLKELAPNAWVLMCTRALTAFLQAQAGRLPRSLALDGKRVGNPDEMVRRLALAADHGESLSV
jgi:hypothetical protein